MKKTNFVFVILCYKSFEDLKKFSNSIENVSDLHEVIVVNSFSDEIDDSKIKNFCLEREYVFLPVSNNGYGYGNNQGIRYAEANLRYDYLIVCNPDTFFLPDGLKKLLENKESFSCKIIAPKIQNLKNKNQNPYKPRNSIIIDYLQYFGLKNEKKYIYLLGAAINRLYRELYNLFTRDKVRVYSCHGSFIIFHKKAIESLYPIFDDSMFLFAEEDHLGQLAMSKKIKIIFYPQIFIRHKEDGSVGQSNTSMTDIAKKSYLHFYHQWRK